MADRLLDLQVGESTLFEAAAGTGNLKQQQVCACASRNGLSGKLGQKLFLAVAIGDREVIDIIRVTRTAP